MSVTYEPNDRPTGSDPEVAPSPEHLLRNALARLDRITTAAGLGGWERRSGSDLVIWDEQMYELLGLERATFGRRLGDFLDVLHPDDRARTAAALERAMSEVGPYESEYRVRRVGGGWRWIRSWGQSIAGPDGAPERLVGVACDNTRVRVERDLVARAIDHVSDVVFSLDHDFRLVYVNARMAELLGTDTVDLRGSLFWDVTPEYTRCLYEAHLLESCRSGDPIVFDYESEVVGGWWEARIQPIPEGYFVYLHDITDRKEIERQRAAALAHHQSVAAALQAAVLPDSLPGIPQVDLAARYRPADVGVNVGGDWYDCFLAGPDRLCITVGDVAGHGLPAASVMGQLRNALRAFVLLGKGPGRVLMRLDELIRRHEPDAMATVWAGELDLTTGQLVWASAGHPPVVLRRGPAGTVLEGAPNPPIGFWRTGASWIEHRIGLVPGDLLLAYTDGLVERRKETLLDGIERLRAVVELAPPTTTEPFLATVFHAQLGSRVVDDDVCALALRVSDVT